MPSRSIHRQVISASAASGEKALTRSITEDYVMFERVLDNVRDVSRKRRKEWRRGPSAGLLGATALTSLALSGPASTPAAAQPQPQRPNILVIMGRRRRLVQYRRLSPWNNVWEDAQSRQAGCAGNDVH